MPPVNPNNTGGEEQELGCSVEDLEFLVAGANHLLVVDKKDLLEPTQSSSLD
jgi:hypothetical protein